MIRVQHLLQRKGIILSYLPAVGSSEMEHNPKCIPFLVGAPRQIVHYGILEIYEDVDLSELLSTNQSKPSDRRSNFMAQDLTDLPHSNQSQAKSSLLLCMLLVPSHMIPCEILDFFGSSLDCIVSINIFRHFRSADKYMAILRLDSFTALEQIIQDHHDQLLSSLDQVHCLLYQIKSIKFSDASSAKFVTEDEIFASFEHDKAVSPHSQFLYQSILGQTPPPSPSTLAKEMTLDASANLVAKLYPQQQCQHDPTGSTVSNWSTEVAVVSSQDQKELDRVGGFVPIKVRFYR